MEKKRKKGNQTEQNYKKYSCTKSDLLIKFYLNEVICKKYPFKKTFAELLMCFVIKNVNNKISLILTVIL